MHILFVVPRFASRGQFYHYPVGLAYVYSSLRQKGFSLSCLNLCHEDHADTRQSLEREISKQHVDLVCTGGLSIHWDLINDILANAKDLQREVITVVGGPIITADPQLALTHLPIDYGVIGEGEFTAVELLKALEQGGQSSAVKGLAIKQPDGQVVLTESREEIADLDALPLYELADFGFRETIESIKYAQQMTILESFNEVRYSLIIGSRSCPFSCTFCYHPLGKKYRQRSLDNIFQEIDYMTKTYGINVFNFLDELFSADHRRMLAFAQRIKPYKVKWTAQFRVNKVKREILEELVAAGLMYVTFGIESMNDDVLKSMNKRTTRAEVITALEAARQARLYCSGNIILGDPADTLETVNDSITWLKNNPVYNVSLGFIIAVPDAPLYRYAVEKGLIKDKLAHVINRLPLVNLSQLSNRQYYALLLKVTWWNLWRANIRTGTLIKTHRVDQRFGNKHFYELLLRCPFCNGEQTHKKFTASSYPHVVFVCINCYSSFKMSQRKAFPGEFSWTGTALFMLIELGKAYTMRFPFIVKHHYTIKSLIDRFVR